MKNIIFLIAALFATFSTVAQVATKAAQDTGNAKLNAIRLQAISNKTVVVSSSTVSSSALPTGAATSANQTTHNTRLLNIENNTSTIGNIDFVTTRMGAVIDTMSTVSNKSIKRKHSYYCSFTLTPASAATEILRIKAPGSGIYFLEKIIITGIQTTASNVTFYLKDYTTIGSGSGTTQTVRPYNSSLAPASSFTVTSHTSNPSAGTGPTNIAIKSGLIPALLGTSSGSEIVFDFTEPGLFPLGFYDTFACYSLHLNGVTLTGGELNICIVLSVGAY